jgi:hypothetical protein
VLKYADEVTVDAVPQDVNLVDFDGYGHRVQVTVDRSKLQAALSWTRAANSARPVGHFADNSAELHAAIVAALESSYTDVDAVSNKLSFSSASLDENTDSRIRKEGVSANDLIMAYVLYKVYGSSSADTSEVVFNLQDAHDMLQSSAYADAIISSFETAESQSSSASNEKGAIDAMFRDLLAADPMRFFDASGAQVPGLFETSTDVSGAGNWNLVDGDTIEIRTKFNFEHAVTLRTTLDVAQNLSTPTTPEQSNGETVFIPANSTFHIRLQLVAGTPAA